MADRAGAEPLRNDSKVLPVQLRSACAERMGWWRGTWITTSDLKKIRNSKSIRKPDWVISTPPRLRKHILHICEYYSGFSSSSPSQDSCHSDTAVMVGEFKFHPVWKRQHCGSANTWVIGIEWDDNHVHKSYCECMKLDGSHIGHWIL